jgi:murein DD-endopeptidase MepM/ murein hydrolase activator NlpD
VSATPLPSLATTAGATISTAPKKDDRAVAAKQLEAFFLRQVLKEARPDGSGLMSGGFAGETFRGMLDEQLADKMSGGAGLGLAQVFAKQLGPAGSHGGDQVPGSIDDLAAAGRADLPAGAPALILPVSGRPTSGYGLRKDPVVGTIKNHPGIDLAAPMGAPVDAAAAGQVTHAGPGGTYGNLVTIRHANGYETRYAHLSKVLVHEGDKVGVGTEVGEVGSTGLSIGPHLHFEVRHDEKLMDPADLLPPLNRSNTRPNR